MSRAGAVLDRLVDAWADFRRANCLLLAAGLSYATVLSLVPFLAVAFSVAKGFGVYEAPFLREALLSLTAEKADVVDAILGYIGNTDVKALGLIGVATLFVTAVGLLGAIEEAFNAIWQARARDGTWSRFSNAVTVILVCPVFILAAFSATATLQNAEVTRWMLSFSMVNAAYALALKAVPYLMVWVALFVLYRFLPNVRVRGLPALAGALVAGVAWQATQAVYIRYQVGVTGYNAIYGSFAQIPLLLVWLYVSWVIVLAGAVLTQAVQRGPGAEAAKAWSQAGRRRTALVLAALLAEHADADLGPVDEDAAARELGLPAPAVAGEFSRLESLGLAARVAGARPGRAWVLAAAPDRVCVGELAAGLDALGTSPDLGGLELDRLDEALTACLARAAPMTLRELVDQIKSSQHTGMCNKEVI